MRGMRTHTIIRLLAATVFAASALALSACGSEGEAGGSAGDRNRQEARDAALAFAQCMREHGVDMPDPTFEGNGVLQRGPDQSAPRATVEEAEDACKEKREAMEPSEPPSEDEQHEMKERALANARCMREHGIENFPDPTFGENGEIQLRLSRDSGIDPNDEEFKEAQEACRSTMPGFGGPSGESTP
jgi:hypothetical protein